MGSIDFFIYVSTGVLILLFIIIYLKVIKKRDAKALLFLGLGIVGLFFSGPFIIAMSIFSLWYLAQYPAEYENNKQLTIYESQSKSLQHPNKTERIDFKGFFGNSSGASNHCEFIVYDLRSYTSSKNDIIEFYKRKKIYNGYPPPNYQAVNISFEFLEKDDKGELMLPDDLVIDWQLNSEQKNKNLYYINLEKYGAGENSYDFRCH
jgi:hypothetical protein